MTFSESIPVSPEERADVPLGVPLPPPGPEAGVCLVGPGWTFTSGISYYTCRLANAVAESHPNQRHPAPAAAAAAACTRAGSAWASRGPA